MTMEEYLQKPCGICGKQRNEHVGRVLGCFGGYGTSWNPDGERDYRVWPQQHGKDCCCVGCCQDRVMP